MGSGLGLMGLSGSCSGAMSAPQHSLRHCHVLLLHWCLERDLWDYTTRGPQSSCISQQTYQISPVQVQHEGASAAHSPISCPHCWVKRLRVTRVCSGPFQLLLLEHRAMEEDVQCIASHRAGPAHCKTLPSEGCTQGAGSPWSRDQNSPLPALTMRLPQTLGGFS